MQPIASPKLPRILADRYELLSVLGEGSQGIVYEGRHLLTRRPVAVKTLRPRAASHPELAARFLQEARIASAIRHPNLVEVLDMGEDPMDGTRFLVQPLLVGRSLDLILNDEKTLSPRTALEILVPILGAVGRLHRDGIVHRDIKPANILVTRPADSDLVPVLIDLGVSKAPDGPTKAAVTADGAILGTPYFMSPEQLMGERSEGPQTDIWSLGVVLYQALSGRVPFEGATLQEVLHRIRQGPPTRLDTIAKRVSPQLASIVHRAMEPDRGRRFPAIDVLLKALVQCPAIDPTVTGHMLARRHSRAIEGLVPTLFDTFDDDGVVTEVIARNSPPAAIEGAAVEWVPPRIVARVPVTEPGPPPSGGVPATEPVMPATVQLDDAPVVPMIPAPLRRIAAIIALALAVALGVFIATRPPDPTTNASFDVTLRVAPSGARIELDGHPVGVGTWRASLPRDGVTHLLRVSAPDHVTQRLYFADAPPPSTVTLDPVSQ